DRPYNSTFDTGACWTAPFRDGLPTPPHDMAGPSSAAIARYRDLGLPSIWRKSNVSDNHARPHLDSASSSMVHTMKPEIHRVVKSDNTPASESVHKKSISGSQLRIPSTINNSKSSLAEFAAQMTCLFWFEKTSKLQSIENRSHPVPFPLGPGAIPTPGFQKWVSSILSTTQVSQNVILLALLFIYRLKKFNAGVKGKKGSEYRLMTVALMLGNKFLDDNTYTNKTWAEVSGIAVQEIHVMEVEFLSNIRYDLFCSEAEWSRWHTKLGLFGDYFNEASMITLEDHSIPHVSPHRLLPPSPPSKLPSPPTDVFRPQSQPNWYMPVPGLPYPVPAQLGDVPMVPRKRSRDDETETQPSKRVAHTVQNPATAPPHLAIPNLPPVLTPTSVAPGPVAGTSRLPLPSLPPSNSIPQTIPSTPASQLPAPPTIPAVYNRPANWTQQIPAGPLPPVASGIYNSALSDLARYHHSPFGVTTSTVSPAVSAYSVHTPQTQTQLSPSFFLANRNSPYRPVRSVHTLLIPPPSTSMQQQRSVPFDHMHYQPLSKGATDRKTGLLPYIHPDAWNQGSFHSFYTPSQTFSG
ncbi:hypothetical protein N7495_002569, partial [Penicillium taxi]|uniref:uncharacterized protein n=1 Tax=Penicillium taxi TaxID=168475 RepID=UPI00254515B7